VDTTHERVAYRLLIGDELMISYCGHEITVSSGETATLAALSDLLPA